MVWQRIQNFFSNFAEIMVNSVKVVLLTIKKGSIERQIADELEKGGWASMEDVPAIRDISEVSGISGFEGIGDNPRRLLPELEELTKEIDKLKGLGNESIIGDTTITTMDEIRARFESLRKEIGLLDAESFLKLLEGDSEGDSGGKDVLDAFTPTPEQIKHWEALNKHKAQYVEPIPPSFWDSFSEGIKHVRNETDLLRLAFISAFQALKLNAEEAKAATKAVERTFQDLGKVMELSFQNRIREIDYWKYHKMNALDDQRNAEIAALTAGIHDEERKNKIVADYDKKHAAKKKYLEQKAAYDTWKIQVEQFKIKKALDLASIVMNTSVGVMQTYAQVGGVLGKVLSGAVLAAGVTAFALTAAKEPPPPPRFQTGGRFVVPGSPGAYPDNVGLRVNPGETVDITPRGVEPERNITVVVQLDSDVLFREVQRGIDGGEIIINTEEFTK